jgi:16S rRNA (adenine1518-N6/adenine1519-N6)-dimethyltransferase
MSHIPRKRFSQNFLTDESIVNAIVSAVNPMPGETVVEIGPGLGALTRPLLRRADRLHVVEIDRDIIARLRASDLAERLTIHEGDVLDFDFGFLGTDLRVVGNLPYHISTPILFHLARYAASVKDIFVMLQREVVDRMVALPATPDYGRLSITVQYRYDAVKLFEVPPESFRPSPKVTSAIARLVPRAPDALRALNEKLFDRIVTQAFTQRRKTLRNALHGYLGPEDYDALGIDPVNRAEVLSVESFIRIADRVESRARTT